MNDREQIGPFRVVSAIRPGGAGQFFHTLESATGRPYTVWVAPGRLTSSATRTRLLAELSFANGANGHANVLDLLGIIDDECALVLSPFEGGSLWEYVQGRGGRLSPFELREVMSGVLLGLEHAHKNGVLHRGLSPHTVFVDDSLREIRVAGFGIASALETERAWVRTQSIFGDAEFMAPEQFLGEHVDQRTDVYAAGMLLYALIAGRTPFHGKSLFEVMQGHTSGLRPDPAEFAREASPEMAAILRKATARYREDRFPDVRAMLDALTAASQGETGILPSSSATGAFDASVPSWGAQTSPTHVPASAAQGQVSAQGTPQPASSWNAGQQSAWSSPPNNAWVAPSSAGGSWGQDASNNAWGAQNGASQGPNHSPNGSPQNSWGAKVAAIPSPAANSWNAPPPQASATVKKPIWKRWWFILLAILGVIILLTEIFLPDLEDEENAGSGGVTTNLARNPSIGRSAFTGECAWTWESAEISASTRLQLAENDSLPSLSLLWEEDVKVRLANASSNEALGQPIYAKSLDYGAYWFAPESKTHWVFLLTHQEEGRPSRLVVTQIFNDEIVTTNELFMSQSMVSSVDLDIKVGSDSCEFEISVTGDQGRGTSSKSMRIAPTPVGVIVVDGALADLWTDIEAPDSSPFE